MCEISNSYFLKAITVNDCIRVKMQLIIISWIICNGPLDSPYEDLGGQKNQKWNKWIFSLEYNYLENMHLIQALTTFQKQVNN